MANRVCVLDIPGLSRELLVNVPSSSALGKWLDKSSVVGLTPSWPAVTCSVQATLTTGLSPEQHGIVANGLPTFRSSDDQALVDSSNFAEYRKQVSFWEQSNQILQAPRFWQDTNGRSRWKTAMLFFQNSMPGFHGQPKLAADIVLTPKPDHGPDGKLVSLCWSEPKELIPQLFKEFGFFPLMNYWGPMAGIAASQWIASAAARVWQSHQPQLQLTYIPHLDYDLQRFGPHSPQAIKAVQDVSAALEPLVQAVLNDGGKLVLLSEYAMREVKSAIQPNLLFAKAGLLKTRTTSDGVLIDYQQSDAVAMVDHQIAHVYVRSEEAAQAARDLLRKVGALVMARGDLHRIHLNHRRAGDLLAVAPEDGWFDYRWWSEESAAPVFAGTVDIHRKPGYDPLELFFDPPNKRISFNTALVRGSHGIVREGEAVLAGDADSLPTTTVKATEVASLLQRMLG
jgi:predicted AlkP superfamily pyrophosphatase or phosphodiesterase